MAVEFRSTGQPAVVAPVSTFNEKMKCFVGEPLIKASKNNRREARSTTGVPVMPVGKKPPHGVFGTGGPISVRDQITVPVVALSAYTLFDSVTAITIGPFGPPSI